MYFHPMAEGRLELRAGALALVRAARGGAADGLGAERAALERLAGLSVPEVLAWEVDGDHHRLTTTFAPPAPGLTTAVLRAVAEVVSAAHDRGVVHGALDASSVRVDGDRVVVAGWGHGGSPTDDVAALGRLLDGLTDAAAAPLARRALADDPSTRPTMAAIAGALALRTPAARAPRPRPVSPVGSTRAGRRHGTAAVAALVAVVLVGAGLAAARPSGPGARPRSDRPATNVVDRDGVAVRVGRRGDVAVVGDWNCDGTPTPALLRPAAGVVWRWGDWEGRPEAAQAAAGAAQLRVEAHGPCDRLVVLDAAGVELAG